MSHESFWDFSLRLYRLPQVSDTCLTLQNVHGFDVNLLLFACWYGRAHGAISLALLSEVLQFSTHWSTEVVRPLRHARTWMKGELAQPLSHVAELSGVAELREKIKAVELRSEQLQQQALERLAQECLRTQLSIRLRRGQRLSITIFCSSAKRQLSHSHRHSPICCRYCRKKRCHVDLRTPSQRLTIPASISKRSSTRPTL